MKKNLSIAAFSSLIMFLILRWQGNALITAIAPRGIVDLEFTKTPQRLHELLIQWDLTVVKMNVWIDFLFIVAYVLFLSIAAEYCSLKWPAEGFQKLGLWLARIAYVAGVFDIAENLFMLQSVAGNYTPTSLVLTSYCASIKFILAGFILLYLLVSLPAVLKKNK